MISLLRKLIGILRPTAQLAYLPVKPTNQLAHLPVKPNN